MSRQLETERLSGLVPKLRSGILRSTLGAETVVWQPESGVPTALDPVASVLLDVIDGSATVAQIISEVHEEVGVDRSIAERQVGRALTLFDDARLLEPPIRLSNSENFERNKELFVSPPNP